MKPRKLGLLLLILGFGAAVETAWSVRGGRHGLWPAGCGVFSGRFSGPSFEFESRTRHALAGDATVVEVENVFGSVRLGVGEPGEVTVRLRKVVYLPGAEEAEAFAGRIRTTAVTDGAVLRIATNRKELHHGRDVGFETHLDVLFPPGSRVQVQNEHGTVAVSGAAAARLWAAHGDVRADGIAGDARIDSRHGNVVVHGVAGVLESSSRHGRVEIRDVQGAVTVTHEHGSVTTEATGPLEVLLRHGDLGATRVRGALRVQGSRAGVQAADVEGPATVTSSFRDTELVRVTGPVDVRLEHAGLHASDLGGSLVASTTHGDVVVSRVAGRLELQVEHAGVRAEDVSGGVRLGVSGDDVLLSRFSGAVDAEVKRGDVRLIPAGPVSEPLRVETRYGDIRIEIPAGSRFELTASARGGVDVDLGDLVVIESGATRVRGRLGDGSTSVSLSALHGQVKVEPGPASLSGR